jgi:hypothetical protein
MPLFISCPNCRSEGSLPDHAQGVVRCPNCGQSFPVPAAGPPGTDSGNGFSVWVGPDPPPPTATPTLAPDANSLPSSPDGVPIPITAENAAAHLYWLQEEVRRFNGFVARQLENLRQQRAQIAAIESQSAATFATRHMELNRGLADLAARSEALDRREAELAEERAALGRRADEVQRMERAVQVRLEEIDELEQTLRGELEEREAETMRQRQAIDESLRELRARIPVPSEPASLLGSWHCG